MAAVKLADIIEHENLENLTPEIDIKKIKVTQPDINRPALQMAGYFEHFEATRLQIIGFVEYSYMESLTETDRKSYTRDCWTILFPVLSSVGSLSQMTSSGR